MTFAEMKSNSLYEYCLDIAVYYDVSLSSRDDESRCLNTVSGLTIAVGMLQDNRKSSK